LAIHPPLGNFHPQPLGLAVKHPATARPPPTLHADVGALTPPMLPDRRAPMRPDGPNIATPSKGPNADPLRRLTEARSHDIAGPLEGPKPIPNITSSCHRLPVDAPATLWSLPPLASDPTLSLAAAAHNLKRGRRGMERKGDEIWMLKI
jgi:hypothetical protein